MNELQINDNGISAAFGPQNQQAVVNVIVAATEDQLMDRRDEVRETLAKLAAEEDKAIKAEREELVAFHKASVIKTLEPAAKLAEAYGLRSFGSEYLADDKDHGGKPLACARYRLRQSQYEGVSMEIKIPAKLGKEPKELVAARKKRAAIRATVLDSVARLGRIEDAIADMGRVKRKAEAALVVNGVKGTQAGEELQRLVASALQDVRKRIG